MGMFPPFVFIRPSFPLLLLRFWLRLLLWFFILVRLRNLVGRNLDTYLLNGSFWRRLCGGKKDAIFIEDLNELIRVWLRSILIWVGNVCFRIANLLFLLLIFLCSIYIFFIAITIDLCLLVKRHLIVLESVWGWLEALRWVHQVIERLLICLDETSWISDELIGKLKCVLVVDLYVIDLKLQLLIKHCILRTFYQIITLIIPIVHGVL